jgi:hypothetical protein
MAVEPCSAYNIACPEYLSNQALFSLEKRSLEKRSLEKGSLEKRSLEKLLEKEPI